MSFDLGNILVLVAVVVILVIYRQLDKNNRSLDRVRKYADSVRQDLSAFVDERTASIKDFETILKVHDRTAAEILRRIQAVEGNLLQRTPEIELLQTRLDQYAASLTDLEAQISRVDNHLDRLKEEAVFVDRVSQRIKGAGDQMTALEADFARIRQEFADVNAKDLEAVRRNAFQVFEKETLAYVQQLRDAQRQVEGFQTFVTDLEARQNAEVEAFEVRSENFRREFEAARTAWAEAFVARQTSMAEGSEGRVQTFAQEFEARQNAAAADAARRVETLLADAESTLETKAQSLLDGAEDAFRRAAAQAEDLSSEIFVKLEQRIEARADEAEAAWREDLAGRESALRLSLADLSGSLDRTEAAWRQDLAARETAVRTGLEVLQKNLDQAEARVAETRTEVEDIRVRARDDVADLQAALAVQSAQIREGFQGEQAQLLALVAQLKTDLETKVAETRRQTLADAEALKAEFTSGLEVDRQAAQALAAEVRDFVAAARRDTQEVERRTLEDLESRLRDYEASFAYRYGKMEEAEADLAALDTNLRAAMERVADRIRGDFRAFDEAMVLRRQEEEQRLQGQIDAARSSMERLDKDLEDLKARAYDNVSAKLQGFEEEFFQDLQKRNASVSQSLEDWQAGLRSQLEDLRTAADRERAAAEAQLTEALKAGIADLQTASVQQLERLDRQVREAQESTEASVRSYRDGLEETKAALAGEVADLEKALAARLDQERARVELGQSEALVRLERDLEGRMKGLGEEFDQFKAELRTGFDGTQADLGLWQTKATQRFKELEADLGDQYRSFKTSLADKISELTDEFTLQKDELITRSAEDRAGLKADLALIRSGIDDLETQLKARAQAAAEAFERDYEVMSQDFQKRNRDLAGDVENRLKDYRASVNDIREKSEALQKKLFGRIEDQANLLTVNLEEIEKRQKNFVAQTKVFERADALKQELQESIEDLKGDLARIEVQRKDLFEIEAAVGRVKKLGDETAEKAARWNTEKKRIDMMDADFQKVLSLSQSMELRLEQVTTSHDLLQDIQVRIRKLEDYSKDIEVRYDRLEKRREVLDTTTDGVDRNFALLEKMEKVLRGLEGEVKELPAEVEELRKRVKTLSQGKEDADKAVEKLIYLDKTLQDIEVRIGKMEKAREWLAGVETRLTETKEAADEQLHTLATITKASTPAGKGGLADKDFRETVLKLARQGWSKEEIAKATRRSVGEVDLVLELGPR